MIYKTKNLQGNCQVKYGGFPEGFQKKYADISLHIVKKADTLISFLNTTHAFTHHLKKSFLQPLPAFSRPDHSNFQT